MRIRHKRRGLRHPFRRIPGRAWAVFVSAVVGSSAWYLTSNYRAIVRERIADAKAWRIEGPPCPRITMAQFLGLHRKGPRSFEYQGVRFYRRYGHVSCAPIYYHGGRGDRLYPVCQFTGPADLLIRTRKGDWYFRPGPGQAATVSVAHDEARCVMAAKFTLASLRDRP